MERNLRRAKGYTRSMPKVYISLPWGVGFHPSHPLKVGAIFFLKNFNFCPLRGGRSRFSDFKHLFGVGELFEADISLLMFDPPRADRLAVIRRRRRDFRRFLLKSFSRIFSQEGTLLISFFAFFISLYMYISESVIISDSLFQKTAFSFRRLVGGLGVPPS